MEDYSKLFTKLVKLKLKRSGKSCKRLSEEIEYDYSSLGRILNNQRKLDYNLAMNIADNLDINIDKFRGQVRNDSENVDELLTQIETIVSKIREQKK